MATSLPPGGRRVSKAASRASVGISPPRRKESPVPACANALYRDFMQSLRSRLAFPPGRPSAVLTELWSPVTWRATRNALTGLLVAVVTAVILFLPCVLWGAAIFAVTSNGNNAGHVALYVAA